MGSEICSQLLLTQIVAGPITTFCFKIRRKLFIFSTFAFFCEFECSFSAYVRMVNMQNSVIQWHVTCFSESWCHLQNIEITVSPFLSRRLGNAIYLAIYWPQRNEIMYEDYSTCFCHVRVSS